MDHGSRRMAHASKLGALASWLMSKKIWPKAWGTQRQILVGHEPWALSHEPWAMSHEHRFFLGGVSHLPDKKWRVGACVSSRVQTRVRPIHKRLKTKTVLGRCGQVIKKRFHRIRVIGSWNETLVNKINQATRWTGWETNGYTFANMHPIKAKTHASGRTKPWTNS